jgi:hypothetical protein
MELKEIGRQLLNEEPDPEEHWKVLVSEALLLIQASQSVSELSSFFRMGPFDFPEEVTVSTLERMLELGDMSKDTLWAYVSQLGLYFVKQGLYQWLLAELKRLEASGGTDEEYQSLGEEVLRRLRDTNVDG